ncbi:hypothetical protein V6N13_033588 [Hibiscus sabdariffa]
MYSGKEYCSAVSTIGLSEDKMWRQVWSKFVPTNVSVFVWRALHGRIATSDELNKRGVQMIESSVCNQLIWYIALFGFSWTIWLHRNDRIFKRKVVDEAGIYDLSLLRIGHWAKCNWPRSIPSILDFIRFPHLAVTDSDQNFDRSFSCWSAPPYGCLKFNVDAVVLGSFGKAGIGGILRDGEGLYGVALSGAAQCVSAACGIVLKHGEDPLDLLLYSAFVRFYGEGKRVLFLCMSCGKCFGLLMLF